METHIVKKIKDAGRWDCKWMVVNKKTKEVVSTRIHKKDAEYDAFSLNISDPSHPKHWLHLSTTSNSGVTFN